MTQMLKLIYRFLSDTRGAVTVDWVVLTALIVGLAAPIGINYVGQLTGAAGVIASNVAAQSTLLPD